LREEFEIGLKLKRIKKRLKRTDDKLTLYQMDHLEKQTRTEILNGIIHQFENREIERDRRLEENRLYREMFNIQETVSIKKEEERVEVRKVEKQRHHKSHKRGAKANDDYMPSTKSREIAALGVTTNEDKVKKEELIEKNPIRFYLPNNTSSITPSHAIDMPIKMPPINVTPFNSFAQLIPQHPTPQAEIKNTEKLQNEVVPNR
jgi:hypothetical protein